MAPMHWIRGASQALEKTMRFMTHKAAGSRT